MPQDNRPSDQSKEVVGASTENTSVADKALASKSSAQDEAYRKLQSRADQAEAMLEKVKPFLPVMDLLDKKPELYEVLEKAAFPSQHPAKDERPKPPQRPASYNHAEAVTDPNSDSYKYRAAKEDYDYAYAEFQERREQRIEVEQQQRRDQERNRAKMEEQRQQTIKDLREKDGLSNDEINDFLETMTSDASLKREFMVDYWKHLRGRTIIDHKNKQLDVLARRTEATAGTDLGRTAAAGAPSAEDGFNAFMKGSARKIVEHRR